MRSAWDNLFNENELNQDKLAKCIGIHGFTYFMFNYVSKDCMYALLQRTLNNHAL